MATPAAGSVPGGPARPTRAPLASLRPCRLRYGRPPRHGRPRRSGAVFPGRAGWAPPVC